MDLIINFTPTGMIPTKEMTPHVPITPDEIIEDIRRAVDIGITMVHLHARDTATGQSTYKAETYGKIIAGIRSFSKDLVVCVSLSGRDISEFEKRAEPLQLEGDLKPDMGSLTLSSLNFNLVASVNSPEMIQMLAAGMINYAKYLERKGILEPPHYFNLLLGNIACAQADLLHVGIMIRDLPEHSLWTMAGIGNYQLMMNSVAIVSGGGVRVGLEDNIWFDKARTSLATNSDLLRRIHKLAEASDRKVMSPAKLRELLNLQPGDGKYGRAF